MKKYASLILGWVVVLLWAACSTEPPEPTDPTDPNKPEVDTEIVELDYPDHFPDPYLPSNNPLTQAKIDLGKKLFFDPILSVDESQSCGSCHFQENAFADPRPFSPGVGGAVGSRPELRRNAPPLFNLAWHPSLFWDGAIEDPRGRNDQLENQARVPIEAPHEMNSNFPLVMERLKAHQAYPDMFWKAFGDTVTERYILQALASFERTLISADSKWDRYMRQGQDTSIFTDSELRGMKLYFAETGERHAECFHCHGGFNFDDPAGEFRNNGFFDVYDDQGRFLLTGSPFDVGKFKVPSLRNIEYTAPYMHDGSFNTLDEVLDRYLEVGHPSFDRHENTDLLISNIVFTEEDKDDLIAFLKTLSDPNFINNPAFSSEQ